MKAPVRDVVRVLELEGQRGGLLRVMILSCGCYLTRSSKANPPRTARCVACFVAGAVRDSVAGMQSPSLGRVVLIKVSDTEFAPAFVTKVHNDTCVNVTIFHDGGSVEPRSSVLFGDHSLPDAVNTWAWPPRV